LDFFSSEISWNHFYKTVRNKDPNLSYGSVSADAFSDLWIRFKGRPTNYRSNRSGSEPGTAYTVLVCHLRPQYFTDHRLHVSAGSNPFIYVNVMHLFSEWDNYVKTNSQQI